MNDLAVVIVDAQPRGMTWVCESEALAWQSLSDYVAKRWMRVWCEEPDRFGEDEVRHYFKALTGLASFSITLGVKPRLGPGRFLSYAADFAVSASSTVALFHIIAEYAQGRTGNMAAYLGYVALVMATRFGPRVIGGSK